MTEGLGIGMSRASDVEMNGAHAGSTAAIDIALLVVDEDASAGRKAERLGDEGIGAWIGLEDAGIGGVDDEVEEAEQWQPPAEIGAVEQVEFV